VPIYEYRAKLPELGCELCQNPFEAAQNISDPPLNLCPRCEQPVVKLISTPASPRENILTPKNLVEKGFTQYKRKGDGYYEKSAGKGPDTLHR